MRHNFGAEPVYATEPACRVTSEQKQIQRNFYKAAREFFTYIGSHQTIIPSYSDRYHHKEAISSSFAESTVNELISKRMVKKQQMRWTKKGAHLLLQLRVKTLNKELLGTFHQWYPQMNKGGVAKGLDDIKVAA